MKLHSPRHDPYSTLEQTRRKLKDKGYTASFKLSPDGMHIEDQNGHEFGIKSVALNSIYKFVGKKNEAEESVLYALSTNIGINGVLLDGYGKNSTDAITDFIQKVGTLK